MSEDLEKCVNPKLPKEVMESFGWELKSFDGIDKVYTRDIKRKHYLDLVTLEQNYVKIFESEIKEPKQLNKGLLIFLLVLAIIPGLFYLVYKINKKTKYEMALEAKNDKLQALCLLGKKYQSLN